MTTSHNIGLTLLLLLALTSFANHAEILLSKRASILVGADQPERYLPLLQGKNIAVVVNQTSRVNLNDSQESIHLVDYLDSHNVNVQVIYAPEHGFRGKYNAGEIVKNELIDSHELMDSHNIKKGIGEQNIKQRKIISLYGKNKKPQQKDLNGVDWLVFDIQDVGVRFYTYVSSMHYLMEACAEYQIPLLVLDRPNPNGDYVDGPVLKMAFQSFVGMHPIPLVHGLTVAELALMINGEGWLSDGKTCELTIVKNKSYQHSMRYILPIPPSTNLPNNLSVRLYPSLGLFEGTPVSVGRGTPLPFQQLGYPLKSMGTYSFVPEEITGSWSRLNYSNQRLYGNKIERTFNDKGINEPMYFTLSYIIKWRDKLAKSNIKLISRAEFFDKLAGSSQLRLQLTRGDSEDEIRQSWKNDLIDYKILRNKYLLYPTE